MPFRFFKSFKIAPGLRLNVSKRGLGLSQKIGPVTIGTNRTTVNLPGTGVSYYQNNSTGSSNPTAATVGNGAKTLTKILGMVIGSIVCICFGFVAIMAISDSINPPLPTPDPITLPLNTSIALPSATDELNAQSDALLATLSPAQLSDVTDTPGPIVRSPIPPPTRRPSKTPDEFAPTFEAMTSVALTELVPHTPVPKYIIYPSATKKKGGGGSTGGGCCKVCVNSKPCGDSCISTRYTCHQGPGCAC